MKNLRPTFHERRAEKLRRWYRTHEECNWEVLHVDEYGNCKRVKTVHPDGSIEGIRVNVEQRCLPGWFDAINAGRAGRPEHRGEVPKGGWRGLADEETVSEMEYSAAEATKIKVV